MKFYDIYSEELNYNSYVSFIKYALSYSDAFSLVYEWSYQEDKAFEQENNKYYNMLKQYCIKIRNNPVWPNTTVLPNIPYSQINSYNYKYEICFYKSTEKAYEILLSFGGLFGNINPTDLCFYKNHKCWFATTSHEGFACLYTDSEKQLHELYEMGLLLGDGEVIDDNDIFHEEY